MKIELTEKQCMDIEWSILMAIHTVEKQRKKEKKELESPLTKKLLKLHDYIREVRGEKDKTPEKTESDPFDPYKRKYYASKGFYQQLRAADMMGYKSEGTLVKYRKNGVLKENIHWIRTVGRGISYNPEKCKQAIEEAKFVGY
tara:strand:- start:46 stop:474 length:429 start_codon:yes stop_codon:yes gene_type:complete